MSAAGLEYVSFSPGTGYGDAAAQYVAGLDALGVPVRWTVVPPGGREPIDPDALEALLPAAIAARAAKCIGREIETDRVLLHLPPPGEYERWLRLHAGKRAFAYVAWELEALPQDWPAALAPFERVFVPSEFSRRALAGGGVETPVEVLPHVARDVDCPTMERTPGDDFVFYTIGAWSARKAVDEAVRAYLETFSAADPVELVVKTGALDEMAWAALPPEARRTAPKEGSTWWSLARLVGEFESPARVALVPENSSAAEVDRLHSTADAYLSLSRAEGFGLTAFDALLHGNPAIVTGWGGGMEYLGDSYPLRVDYELESTTLVPDDLNHMRTGGARWARASREHAGRLMRRVIEEQDSMRALALDLRSRLIERYSPARLCSLLSRALGFGG